MPLTQKGSEILRKLREEYGEKKGESVFYAMKNKGELTGVDAEYRARMHRALDRIMDARDKGK